MAKHIAIITMGAFFLCGLSQAQNTPSSSNQPGANSAPQTQAQPPASQSPAAAATSPAPPRIAPGNVIPVQLTKTVDARKAKAGDQVVAKVTMDLKNNSGEVIVPKNTEVIGHVTQVQARNKEQKESDLSISFDQAKMKTGDLQMPMSIQAIIALPSANSSDEGGAPAQASSGASPSAMGGGGRMSPSGGMAPTQQPQTSATPTATTGPVAGTDSQAHTNSRPNITGNTQGVIGIPDLKLETSAQNSAQGSMITSEKNNVKLEGGTLMLLRVSPISQNGASPAGTNQ